MTRMRRRIGSATGSGDCAVLPFLDEADGEPRGLSWSDFAVLFRSVSKDAGPLVEEMKQPRDPVCDQGTDPALRRTRSPGRASGASSTSCRRSPPKTLTDAWLAANLGLTRDDLARGIAVLDEARSGQPASAGARTTSSAPTCGSSRSSRSGKRQCPSAEGTTRGELVFYNLGKFSQAISDFEQIYFQSEPQRKYEGFTNWLVYQAPDYYAESDADVGYATPDAVTIATVHQAKGMQWPAVFVPALRKNRFPSRRQGGLNVFHVIPQAAVPDADRYRGTEADEIRLFYVAVTRAQKYLALSYSPGDSQMYRARSPFFDFATRNPYLLTAEAPVAATSA